MKKLGVALVVLPFLLLLAGKLADLAGASRLARMRDARAPEIAAERARVAAWRRPVLRGEPSDCNAAEAYRRLLVSRPDDSSLSGELGKAVVAGPDAARPEAVAAYAERRATDVAAARHALRCTGADWSLRYEELDTAPLPSLLATRILANLLVLDAYERERASDVPGAAERALDTVRFGSDFASGTLIMNLIGIAVAGTGLDALGALLVSDRAGAVPLDTVAAELGRLEGELPSVPTGLALERLRLADIEREIDSGGLGLSNERLVLFLVPWRAFAANAVEEMSAFLHEEERAVAARDLAALVKLNDAAKVRAESSWNPILRTILSGGSARSYVSAAELQARFRLVQTALRLERVRRENGRFPQTLADLPDDPLAAPARVHYQPAADGTGFKLWSVGYDLNDDGGVAKDRKDTVLARPPKPPPH